MRIIMLVVLLSGCATMNEGSSLITCVPYCHLYVNHPEPQCLVIEGDEIKECAKSEQIKIFEKEFLNETDQIHP